MREDAITPFDNIENAQEYIGLLMQAIAESKDAILADPGGNLANASDRHMQALNLIIYNLDKLSVHMRRSTRILNDLRMLRRLLYRNPIQPIQSVIANIIAVADVPEQALASEPE